MTVHDTSLAPTFPAAARDIFAANYPEIPHKLTHRLSSDARLSLEGLTALAEKLPEKAIEYNRGDLPVGVDGKPGGTGLSIGETIRHIATSNSWAVLKNIEQVPEYRALLMGLLEELRPQIEAATGQLLTPQAFVFISSPNAVTPYHFDPEHNILLQLTGNKAMTQFPAGDARYAPDRVHESYHLGGPRELPWSEDLLTGGTEFPLAPGEALYVPVMAPHFVRNGTESSISLSVTCPSIGSRGTSSPACMMSATLRRRRPSLPPGCRIWKSSEENPLRSSSATAMASPRPSMTVVDVVGARPMGQASGAAG